MRSDGIGAHEIRRNDRKAHQNQRTTDSLSAQTIILQASCRTPANHVAKTTLVAGVQLPQALGLRHLQAAELGLPILKVALLAPCRQHTSAIGIPASCSFNIAMICSSLNLLRFILSDSYQRGRLRSNLEDNAGLRPACIDFMAIRHLRPVQNAAIYCLHKEAIMGRNSTLPGANPEHGPIGMPGAGCNLRGEAEEISFVSTARGIDRATPGDIRRALIIGAGCGGLSAARELCGKRVEVAIVDRQSHHVFQPLLCPVATAGLSPADIAAPIRSIVRKHVKTQVRLGEVEAIDTDTRRVALAEGDTLPFDYLIVATGAQHGYFGRDEWAEHAPGLKTIDDAARRLGVEGDHAGRLQVEPDLSVAGQPDIFVIGNVASVVRADGRPVPGLAPAAKQMGGHVARVIAAEVAQKPAPKPFHYSDFGNLPTIGRKCAAAEFGRAHIRGTFAWLLGVWRTFSSLLDSATGLSWVGTGCGTISLLIGARGSSPALMAALYSTAEPPTGRASNILPEHMRRSTHV